MILVTGAAGFIGYSLCKRLLEDGELVVGLDNLNDYYDPSLKRARLDRLAQYANFKFILGDITDRAAMDAVFRGFGFDRVYHLAAQAGVRYSLENPQAYIDSNITGFVNVLEQCVANGISHLVYASSSSVYGLNEETPFEAEERTDRPANMYAVTKKANELMAHAYWHLHGLRTTGLRFFTVYGPWGRPDMAFFKFTKAITEGLPFDVYNNGHHMRAFTYIDDVVDGVVECMKYPDGCKVYNIGGDEAVPLMAAIRMIETEVGRDAIMRFLPMQKGDVLATVAAPSKIPGYSPRVSLETGIKAFVDWYRWYHE